MASELISKGTSLLFNSPLYTNQYSRLAFLTLAAGCTLYNAYKWSTDLFGPLFTFEKDLPSRYGKGSWVVITGASDGIGKAYCFALAKRGFNIVLVARNKKKTSEVVKELKEAYPLVDTREIIVDFSQCWQEGFIDKVYNEVIDLDVSILINNVGTGTMGQLHTQNIKAIQDEISINVLAQALMTRIFLPKLLNRPHRSAVISTSSMSALYPEPYYQVYSATKKFNDHFSQGVGLEYPNLDFLSVQPHFVITNQINREVDSITITAEDFAENALRFLGNTPSTHGHWKHRLFAFRMNLLPHREKMASTKERYSYQSGAKN